MTNETASDGFTENGFSGQPLDHCLVVDAHGHLSENPNVPLPDTSLETLIARMDRMGVDVFCCSAIAAIYNQARLGNDQVIAAVRRYPKRFFGYTAVDVGYPQRVIPELERCLAAGLRGVKIYSHSIHNGFEYADPVFQPVFEFANARALPLLAHTFSVKELNDLEQQVAGYPRVRFIMAHTGSCGAAPYVRLAKTYENVYIETCFSVCPRGLFETLVAEGVTGKVLWGSDAYFMDESQQLGRVLFAQIPEDAKRKILGENARRALGIGL
jgi:predicted TIM-barrel fold metal-dependent hydrolase